MGCLAAASCAQALPPSQSGTPDFSRDARLRLTGMDESAEAVRLGLLNEAELALSTGRVAAAEAALERAALMLHAPDTESALVRTYMQAGDYRRALAFAAHAAGAHRREWPAGMALYAWLLSIGGQGVVAQRMLDTAVADAPAQAELSDVVRRLAGPWPRPEGALLEGRLRLAPYAVGTPTPAGAQVVGTAVLLPSGSAAVAPSRAVDGADRIWLRNGLGRTVAATPEGPPDAHGLQRLRLHEPLPQPASTVGLHSPFAGSPGYLLEFVEASDQPTWPLMRQGFFGRPAPAGELRPLGLELPPGSRSGPVFDAQGQWVGLSLRGADGSDRLIDAGTLLAGEDRAPSPDPGAARAPRLSADEIYERGLTQALQVLRQPSR